MKKTILKTETEKQIAKDLSDAVLDIKYIALKNKVKLRTLWVLIHRHPRLSKAYETRLRKRGK